MLNDPEQLEDVDDGNTLYLHFVWMLEQTFSNQYNISII